MAGQRDDLSNAEVTDDGNAPIEAVNDPEDVSTEHAPDGDDDGESPHREAAKYRTRLREVETERDGLSAQLDAMRRAEVARLASAKLADADDLLMRHEDVSVFVAEDGSIDPHKVAEAVDTLVAERPYLTGRRFHGSADGGVRGSSAKPRSPRIGGIFSDDAA